MSGKGKARKAFVQWKNTNVCIDFTCSCGAEGHVDDYVFGRWYCPACQQHWRLDDRVKVRPVAPNDSTEAMDVDGHGPEPVPVSSIAGLFAGAAWYPQSVEQFIREGR